jgi:hypothetical protein
MALAALTSILIGVNASRVGASDPGSANPVTELEIEAYNGTAAGRFPIPNSGGGCAGTFPPAASLRYAGLGGRVRFFPSAQGEHPRASPEGFQVSAAVASEYHHYELLDVGSAGESNVPPPLLRSGFLAELGHDGTYFGFRGGVLLYQKYDEIRSSGGCDPRSMASPPGCEPAVAIYDTMPISVWPDLRLRFGPLDLVRFEIGLGSYNVPTLLRPGGYLGAGVSPATGWDIAVHYGIHDLFHGEAGTRWDLTAKVPVSEAVRVGASVAESEGGQYASSHLEGGLLVNFSLGGTDVVNSLPDEK